MDRIQGMGALRWEKPLEGPQLSLIMQEALHSVQPAPPWATWLPPSPLHLPAPPSGLEVLALPEDKIEQRVTPGHRRSDDALPHSPPPCRKDSGKTLDERRREDNLLVLREDQATLGSPVNGSGQDNQTPTAHSSKEPVPPVGPARARLAYL